MGRIEYLSYIVCMDHIGLYTGLVYKFVYGNIGHIGVYSMWVFLVICDYLSNSWVYSNYMCLGYNGHVGHVVYFDHPWVSMPSADS